MNRLLLPLLLCSILTQAQNILRVNNNVGVNAPYTTLAAAITAAGANDIIMVEGSLVAYADITINKKVTIIGPGYFLSENLNLQASPFLSASIATLTITTGADGSSFHGMNFTSSIGMPQGISVNNITISNSRMNAIALFGIGNNFFISGCYISNLFNFSPPATYTGTTLTNNYIGGISGTFSTSATSLVTLTQNVFGGTVGSLRNCDIRNNIFLSTISGPATGAFIKNNVFNGSQASLSSLDAPVDNTNVFSALTSNLFIGLTGNTTDTQWRLKAGSPAIGAGISGEDCGMYGGNTAYRPSGIQQGQPTITNFTTPASVQQNGTLNVKVSAKVN
jgi:hypothetical protein